MKVNILAMMLIGILLMSIVLVAAFDNKATEEIKANTGELKIRNLDKVDEDSLKKLVPTEIEVKEIVDAVEIPRRFILWTHDGKNVMWGKYGDNYFAGEDNNGKKAWGIYYKGSFAGFYDDHFFYGKYRGHRWKARGLFGMRSCHGEFRTFPYPILTATAIAKPLP